MGDLADCIINAKDPRWDPIEVSRRYNIADMKDLPYKQADFVVRMLEPIGDTIICSLIGNHEEQYIRRHSYNVYGHFCEKFHSCYELGYVGFVKFFLKVKGNPVGSIDIALNHGDGGGGMREGYPVNKVHDVYRWTAADYNIMGHLHVLTTDCKDIIEPSHDGTGIRQVKRWYGISGCFLRTFVNGNRNYFEHKGRPQSDIGMLHARFRIPRQTVDGQRQRVKDMDLEKVWL
jgi:hypothetical protein